MKTNITLKLDADLLTDRLEKMVPERKMFDKARRGALARLREGLDLHWTLLRSRDELHER